MSTIRVFEEVKSCDKSGRQYGVHTNGGLATREERTKRLGQAMDGNTMRWLGSFLYTSQTKEDQK